MSAPAVLIVDDHASFRRVARRMLEAAGFVVAEAASGVDAVAASSAGRYDLVLLDIQLPSRCAPASTAGSASCSRTTSVGSRCTSPRE